MESSISVAYLFTTIVLSIIAFFLIRFFYLVDEIRKDVKGLLIKESKRDQAIENLKEDIARMDTRITENSRKLNHLEVELHKKLSNDRNSENRGKSTNS